MLSGERGECELPLSVEYRGREAVVQRGAVEDVNEVYGLLGGAEDEAGAVARVGEVFDEGVNLECDLVIVAVEGPVEEEEEAGVEDTGSDLTEALDDGHLGLQWVHIEEGGLGGLEEAVLQFDGSLRDGVDFGLFGMRRVAHGPEGDGLFARSYQNVLALDVKEVFDTAVEVPYFGYDEVQSGVEHRDEVGLLQLRSALDGSAEP